MAGGDAVEQPGNRHVFSTQRAAAAFEAGEIEQVTDDVLESMRLFLDDVQVALARRGVELSAAAIDNVSM